MPMAPELALSWIPRTAAALRRAPPPQHTRKPGVAALSIQLMRQVNWAQRAVLDGFMISIQPVARSVAALPSVAEVATIELALFDWNVVLVPVATSLRR